MTVMHWLAIVGMLFQGLDSRGRHTAPLADHVRLSLSSEREGYCRGEALRLRITAKNTSEVPVTAYFPGLNPSFGRAKVYSRHGGATQFSELDLLAEMPSTIPDYLRVRRTVRGPERKTLHPGQQHDVEASISFVVENGARRFVLDQVGRYEFKVRYADTPIELDPNGVLESDILTVEVVEPPASERDAQAAYTPELAFVAHARPGSLSPEQTRAAAAFIERFPDSRYTRPVKEGLLRSLESRWRMKQASDEELRLYEKLMADVDQTPPPYLSITSPIQVLWPPDDSMVPITLSPIVELHPNVNPPIWEKDLAAHITLESITCDDSCDLANDVAGASLGTEDREFELRAARGRSEAGRTYAITYSAITRAGIRLTSTTKVTVPSYETPPAWSDQNVVYKGGEPITYQGEVWRCVVRCLGRRELSPSPTTSLWVKAPKGKGWDFPVQYAAGAEVTHLGLTYRCLERHISKADVPPPGAPALWTQIP
jgi:hypothetical protein